jgi:hypothetical protein
VGGTGKNLFIQDLGEGYEGINDVGIFIWDLHLKKIIPIDVKIEGNNSEYTFSLPFFSNP